MRHAICLLLVCSPAFGQALQWPAGLDKLAAKATERVDIALDSTLLQVASRFLSAEKPDEAAVKNLVSGLKGVYVKVFKFDKEGEYSEADLEPVRSQVRGPGWSKIVGVVTRRGGDNTEVYVKLEGDRFAGVAIIAAEPKELTVVLIDGSIDLEQLRMLGGHFGIPKIEVDRKKALKTEPK
ncbi:MAG: DUF4252 domain-containing protein [Acidobacteriota bacterium]